MSTRTRTRQAESGHEGEQPSDEAPRAGPARRTPSTTTGRTSVNRTTDGTVDGPRSKQVGSRHSTPARDVRVVPGRPAANLAGAFFDLDRTVLLGASGPAFNEALRRATPRKIPAVPGLGMVYRFYDTWGESLPSMGLARAGALVAKGRPRREFEEAAAAAVDELRKLVAPYVYPLIDEHRQAGRPVVLASTTPRDLVLPFADALGFDDVVATRYATDGGEEDRYTGGIDGEFVWAKGKLTAIRGWAEVHGVSIADSWAYSDSFYDVPLLSAVSHPFAVNPDPRLQLVAALRRWPILHLDRPPGVPKLAGRELVDLTSIVMRPQLFPYARFDVAGVEHISSRGPAILAFNHRSYFDSAAIALVMARCGRRVRAMAKQEMFDAPVIGRLVRASGSIPVDRKGSGADAYEQAARALRAGEVLMMAPQGTIPRGRDFYQPRLRGKTGVARLAATSRAPVIPIGIWGTERVWPRSSRLPNMTNLRHPPTVRVRIGAPVEGLTYQDPHADTEQIMDAIVGLLPPEAREVHEPTAEELALTFPPGHEGDDPAKGLHRHATN